MTVINNNSICTTCIKLKDCIYNKFMRSDCAYFKDAKEVQTRFLCSNCGHPTNPTGRCRTCPLCGETTGCG